MLIKLKFMKAFFFRVSFTLALVAFAFIGSSCNKCTKCEYEYTKNGSPQTVNMEEICGNSQDVDDHVQACQDLAKANNGKCLCSDI
jgi:predicted metal-binding protein